MLRPPRRGVLITHLAGKEMFQGSLSWPGIMAGKPVFTARKMDAHDLLDHMGMLDYHSLFLPNLRSHFKLL